VCHVIETITIYKLTFL